MGETEYTFKAGDKVRHDSYGDGEITYGPLAGRSFTSYVARFDSGEQLAYHPSLTLLPKYSIGDRVQLCTSTYTLKAGPFPASSGQRFYVVEDEDGSHGTLMENSVYPVDTDTETIDGVTYDLSAKYADKDGDTWTLGRDDIGQAVALETGYQVAALSLRGLINSYGPLTRVEK